MSAASDSANKKPLPFEQSNITLASMPMNRIGVVLTIVLAVVTIIAFFAYPILALNWRQQPFFGAIVSHTLVVDRGESLDSEAWPGLAAGLQFGDQILAINEHTFFSGEAPDYGAARADFRDVLRTFAPGDEITVTFRRAVSGDTAATVADETCDAPVDGFAQCRTTYMLTTLSDNNLLGFFGIPYFTAALMLLIGLAVLYKQWRNPTARLVAAITLCAAIVMAGFFDASTSQRLPHLWMFALAMTGGLLIVFSMTFPTRMAFGYRHPMAVYLPIVIAILVTALAFDQFANPSTAFTHAHAERLAGLLLVIGLILVVIRMGYQRRYAVTLRVRNQANIVLSGVLLTLAPALIWMINILIEDATGSELIRFTVETMTPFFILPPLSMAYAVLQFHSVDTDRIVSRGITYTLMLATLIVGYSLLVLGVSLFAGELVSADNTILIAITIFASAFLFMPVRNYLQGKIDAIYYRTVQLYRTRVENFAGKLTSLTRLDDIALEFQKQITDVINPVNLFIFLPDHQSGEFVAIDILESKTNVTFEPENGVAMLLKSRNSQEIDAVDHIVYLGSGAQWPPELRAERARLGILNSAVLAGLHGSHHEFVGFISIGPSRAGSRYTLEQLQYINGLTGQVALAIERANIIDRLERRVREMDVLSKVSEAINFSIEFGVLLELIGEQATRLIEATHLYIVIHDKETKELYYAFFLENGERYSTQENRRWSYGRDLYSDIIASSQAKNVPNYVAAMRERGIDNIREDQNLRAWLGVPLVAQNRTLGVLAAGLTKPGVVFNNDQLRIFSDLGSLAATSLDKALVYSQANTRARQLAALNEINQQLTSELDVDKLLELIITSSANILNVEAASLLLTAEDGSGDLEFRIAVGGSGQDLVGSRIPAGRGLAGEVASSGKPVIVNNASQDPRWSGEAADGDFHTQAVLAVPLVAQGNVVGVLEVINKKDGSIFIDEDVDVLSTFAGQAAVAIENARLFQMTDIQLEQRVAELEVLERIDVELNRSLDLDQVAEITMRWSVNNSNGRYSILGLLDEERTHIEIIATYGYSDDSSDGDAPSDAHRGKILSLEDGIIRRVMRTRQPDLVPDTTIDPDYQPIIRETISQITVPMFTGGEITAILIVETDTPPRLGLLDQAFIQRLAEHASIAIANAQLLDELKRANRSKSEFVSFVAHELKNPLTSIRGYTDVLLAGAAGELSAGQSDFLNTIRQNSIRMDTLISDLNDVTKMQIDQLPMEFSQISFRNVVTETLRPMQNQIDEKDQTLILQLPEQLPDIHGDQNRLIQVLTNFVSNAYKYTPRSGTIIIGAELMDETADNGDGPSREMLHVWVKDDGIGMSEEDLSRLFTPYFRSENPRTREQPGTGLGLTLTRYLIERHGGRVWVESVLDEGTTFHFTLALAQDESTEPEAAG